MSALFDDLRNLLWHLPQWNHERGLCFSWRCNLFNLHCDWYTNDDGRKAPILDWPRRIHFRNTQSLPWHHQSILDDPFIGWKKWQLGYQKSCSKSWEQKSCLLRTIILSDSQLLSFQFLTRQMIHVILWYLTTIYC